MVLNYDYVDVSGSKSIETSHLNLPFRYCILELRKSEEGSYNRFLKGRNNYSENQENPYRVTIYTIHRGKI